MEGVLYLKRTRYDEVVIKKARDGSKEAFTDLIKNNKEYLYKIAYTYVKDESKALDILQECIFRSFKGIKNLKEAKYFKTWITRILINCAIDYINKENKNEYIELDENVNVQEINFNIEERLDLYYAIDKLRPEFRTVIILKYFNDYSIKDISNIMSVPENTIKSHLNRARNTLKKLLKEYV